MLEEKDEANASGSDATEAAMNDVEAVESAPTRAPRKRTSKKAAEPAPEPGEPAAEQEQPPATKAPAKKRSTAKKSAAKKADGDAAETETPATADADTADAADPEPKKAKKSGAKGGKKKAASPETPEASETAAGETGESGATAAPLFQAPQTTSAQAAKATTPDAEPADQQPASDSGESSGNSGDSDSADSESADSESGSEGSEGGGRRRRRRGGRRRRKGSGSGDGSGEGQDAQDSEQAKDSGKESGKQGSGQGKDSGKQGSGRGDQGDQGEADDDSESGGSRRRRRRRRAGENGGDGSDDPQNTVTRVRKGRSPEDEITSLTGSTRLEAKKQRRREGREAGRRRAPIVSEAEFLARRESVDRVMVIREREDLTQIAVLEDKVLVEHYVARESQTSLIGNVYLGRVQNVLPSMEAAFIDIGKGRNAVLYAGEVNWQALGHKEGEPRKIESVLSSGQTVLVQVTKDPIGHKGARLTSQISLPGRFLVYVPDGNNSGISRKLPDTERNRLKALLKEIVPDSAGVIVRTAAEGAAEDELTRDVERLKARWEDIERKAKGSAPQLLYGEPDLTLKVVRDLFTEDFSKLVIEGEKAWDTVQGYVSHVAPDLADRLERYTPQDGLSVFATYRVDEQIAKGLDRKVWLPSGGSLIIDRTEAMTVVDVNTGKFTGSGGNLEETVTKNNLEAAEEIVRQLRLRDIGGIIVVDFIDMVLESNRDLVLRRLVECLGRDRTRHQVAEVTSLGLVQMTRKRIGTGLLEAFSETCEHCGGRGLMIKDRPVDPKGSGDDDGGGRRGRRGRGGRGRNGSGKGGDNGDNGSKPPSPKDVAAMSRHEQAEEDTSGAADAGSEQAADGSGSSEKPAQKPRRGRQPATEEPKGEEQKDQEPKGEQQKTEEPKGEQPEAAASTPPEPVSQEPARESAQEPTREPAPEPERAPQPAAPAVVTRTRRRSASRPAGPPSSQPASGEPASGESAGDDVLPGIGTPPDEGAVEPGTVDVEPGSEPAAEAEPPTVTHVPVKKRGARKR
ncbi:Rne/Rng family ribonuclease [Nocardioides rotundus]|uniref:Rne/Rng family ribonuclease n=1 Tax=Nocardioides rotundus TaxID=1774216 RepID=UPI0029586C27|nr:Rne/Rng family ribonuclease [Nocardioides rotundus]UAL28947.1 Rne/Rng family ribonuclease [Nocardioides rotundus]